MVGFGRLFCESVAEAFRDDGALRICEGADDDRVLERIEEEHPDVVVIDVEKREAEGLGLVTRISREKAGLKLLVFGMNEQHETILRYIEAGARGYVPRSASLVEFREAVELATRGEMSASPEIAYAMFTRLAELAHLRRQTAALESLAVSPRELDILRLMAAGLGNRQIATQLSLSYHTVKNHVQNIFHKLDVKRRIEAVERARKQGWLDE